MFADTENHGIISRQHVFTESMTRLAKLASRKVAVRGEFDDTIDLRIASVVFFF